MRLVLTGGAGFLGSHLCDHLLHDGHEVTVLDNLLTGRAVNLQHVIDHPRLTFIQADVTQPIVVEEPLDAVLHFASPASPQDYGAHPIHTLKAGGLGTYHALGLAKAHRARFLLASSSEVYGDPEVTPQPESYWGHVNPVGPRSVYDEAKRFAEALTVAYRRTHGVSVGIARIFNTYGPRMRLDDGRALPNFITQALRNDPLTIYGDGSHTRSFCYVSDLIEGLLRLLDSAEQEPVNLGNPREITTLELAHLVRAAAGSSSPLTFHPLPEDDPRRRCPDITRARERLGWEPRVGLEEGLRRTIQWFREGLAGRDVVAVKREA